MGNQEFIYKEAFSRNIGWLTEADQEKLRNSTVAIAGMGGVGGNYLLTLARLGVSKFRIADFDQFELANFNRQVGASISHMGQPKIEVMAEMALDINPEAEIQLFKNGVDEENLDSFLEGVDLYLDGLDFFCLKIRERVFEQAYKRSIPCVTVAPIGMGAALVNFLPGKMTFEQYFGLSVVDSVGDKALRFALGLGPNLMHRKYLIVPAKFDLMAQKAPSTFVGCQICAGVAGAEAIKILTGRGKVYSAPYAQHFDAFLNRYSRSYVWLGYKNPLQIIKRVIAQREFLKSK